MYHPQPDITYLIIEIQDFSRFRSVSSKNYSVIILTNLGIILLVGLGICPKQDSKCWAIYRKLQKSTG